MFGRCSQWTDRVPSSAVQEGPCIMLLNELIHGTIQ